MKDLHSLSPKTYSVFPLARRELTELLCSPSFRLNESVYRDTPHGGAAGPEFPSGAPASSALADEDTRQTPSVTVLKLLSYRE